MSSPDLLNPIIAPGERAPDGSVRAYPIYQDAFSLGVGQAQPTAASDFHAMPGDRRDREALLKSARAVGIEPAWSDFGLSPREVRLALIERDLQETREDVAEVATAVAGLEARR